MSLLFSCKEILWYSLAFLLLFCLCFLPRQKARSGNQEDFCSLREAEQCLATIREIRRVEQLRRDLGNPEELATRQAAWLYAKADWTLRQEAACRSQEAAKSAAARRKVREMCVILLRGSLQSRQGGAELQEEADSRLRAYYSDIDGQWQSYAVSVPTAYDPTQEWPLIVSMHGHGWYVPYQGYPCPRYAGAFCLSPQGRGSTDYKELGELDVLAAIAEVKRDFPIDADRVYLTGGSMGGTGSFHLGCHYADQFAAIAPVVGNADHLAWTKSWGWNNPFPGRYQELRDWLQETQTTRAFAGNFLHLPAYVIGGSGDTIVPPAHSRNTVAALREQGCPVEYREYPGCGHGGFSSEALASGLSWACGWSRNPFPSEVRWRAALLKHGKAYWLRMEQMERPLEYGEFQGVARDRSHASIRTSNLLAFSLFRTRRLFDEQKPLFLEIDGQKVILPVGQGDTWQHLRKDPVHGWDLEKYRQLPAMQKRARQEGPISEALLAPFVVVVGTQSTDPEMNLAWQREAQAISDWWKLRNNAPCRVIKDVDCPLSLVERLNVILLGDIQDNSLSALLCRHIPWREALEPLKRTGVELEAPDIGSMLVYPTGEYGPERLLVRLAANSPAAAWQLWGRFGNWFNWGVFDSQKYFDYCVFDARSCSPETMLLLGWFGTDWQVESGKCVLGEPQLREESAPQLYPALATVAPGTGMLFLTELMPLQLDQMRGAFGWGRSFFGETAGEYAIGVRAPASLSFQLGGMFRQFCSEVRLHNPREFQLCHLRQRSEQLRFAVYGDDLKLGEVEVDWEHPEQSLSVSVEGVRLLRLEAVPSGGPSWLHAGGLWLNPRVLAEEMPEEPEESVKEEE